MGVRYIGMSDALTVTGRLSISMAVITALCVPSVNYMIYVVQQCFNKNPDHYKLSEFP